jgi:NAD-dependent deacetylase
VPLEKDIDRAAELLTSARRTVAFTGAGVSTPSGIPDFRSPGSGLWTKVNPMVVASIQAFRVEPRIFYQWMSSTARLFVKAQPNPAHIALAELEELGLLKAVITQNIDNLHQTAGSKRVLELHGHLREAVCMKCQQVVPIEGSVREHVLEGEVPYCGDCGGVLKPMAVFMGEPLPMDVFMEAQMESQRCDLMLVAGSSLTVVPAADLIYVARRQGSKLIVVNYQETSADHLAEVVIREDVAEALPQIVQACRDRIDLDGEGGARGSQR